MEVELTDHLGYAPHQEPPGGAGNTRNGSTSKTLITEQGPVEIKTPRDRDGSFEPKIVRERSGASRGSTTRSSRYSRGLSTRDIEAHLEEIYGVKVGRDLISRVTDAVMEDARAWQTRPLDDVYPVVFLDALVLKLRDGGSVQRRACYLALAIGMEGEREVLGMWFQETEGAKFWMQVLTDLKQRGVQDILICCVDGLKGFPEAIEAIYPQTTVQTCIVHLIRHSLKYVPRRQYDAVVKDLRPIYTATDADAALLALEHFDEKWGEELGVITQAWRSAWEHVTPFMAFPDEVRRVVYTTDENVKGRVPLIVGSCRASLVCGRGRPPSEEQGLGLGPAAQLVPFGDLIVAPHWRRPRPSCCLVLWPASQRRAGDRRVRLARRARARRRGLPLGSRRRWFLFGRGARERQRAVRGGGASARSATAARTHSPRVWSRDASTGR